MDWSSEYLFFRRYNRFYFTYGMFAANSHAFNFMSLKNNSIGSIEKNYTTIAAALTRSTNFYFNNKLTCPTMSKGSNLLILSSINNTYIEDFQSKLSCQVSYNHSSDGSFMYNAPSSVGALISNLLYEQPFSQYLSWCKELYKVTVFLLLTHTFNN